MERGKKGRVDSCSCYCTYTDPPSTPPTEQGGHLFQHTCIHFISLIKGESSVLIMKGGHDQMKNRYGFYSKLRYWRGGG